MDKIDNAITEYRRLDDLADGTSLVHNLNSLSKIIVSFIYIVCLLSFNRYNLTAMVPMILYPALIFALADLSIIEAFKHLRLPIIFVVCIGILNPIFDQSFARGLISAISIALKGILSLMAAYALIATTKIDDICFALRKIHVPKIFVNLLLLTYRYIALMMSEISVMNEAYKLRAPKQKGINYKIWGTFLGQLLLRSIDRAGELYNSMKLRGFNGEYEYASANVLSVKDVFYIFVCGAVIILMAKIHFVDLIGSLFVV